MLAGAISRDDDVWAKIDTTGIMWRDLPVQLVAVADLIATKPGIEFRHLIADRFPVGNDPYPHVVVYRRRQYLIDGHHRAVRWAMRGITEFLARVLVIEEAEAA